jgi:hypothetical protein
MTRTPLRHLFTLLTMSGVTALALPACEKKAPPPPIEIPAPPPAPDAGVVQITPFDDSLDAGIDGTGGGKSHGPYTPTNNNAARVKQCCNAIRNQAKNMGASPEATLMAGVAMQCDLVAAQVAGGSAPEFGQVRQMLKGRTLPAACSGM